MDVSEWVRGVIDASDASKVSEDTDETNAFEVANIIDGTGETHVITNRYTDGVTKRAMQPTRPSCSTTAATTTLNLHLRIFLRDLLTWLVW